MATFVVDEIATRPDGSIFIAYHATGKAKDIETVEWGSLDDVRISIRNVEDCKVANHYDLLTMPSVQNALGI